MPIADKTTDQPEKLTKNFMRPRHFEGDRREPSEFEERVIEVNRVARTVKGGRRIRFRALVVVGNKKGKVGMGIAKANDVSEAVRKATTKAKRNLITVPILDGTIPFETISKFGSAVVMLKPAASGTSIVAGGSVRAVAELAGITDILSKMQGSSSKVNNVTATIKAFEMFEKSEYTKVIKRYSEKKATAVAVPEVKAEAPVETKVEAKAVIEKPAKKTAAKKAPAKKKAA